MSTASRNEEIRRVAAELTGRLAELQEVMKALNALLLPDEADPDKERILP